MHCAPATRRIQALAVVAVELAPSLLATQVEYVAAGRGFVELALEHLRTRPGFGDRGERRSWQTGADRRAVQMLVQSVEDLVPAASDAVGIAREATVHARKVVGEDEAYAAFHRRQLVLEIAGLATQHAGAVAAAQQPLRLEGGDHARPCGAGAPGAAQPQIEVERYGPLAHLSRICDRSPHAL